jgi:predicted DNA-binding ribbon-helix-helix protein
MGRSLFESSTGTLVGHKSVANSSHVDAGEWGDGAMKSLVIKRSIVVDGHKTSVSLEDQFWSSLREIAKAQGETLSHLIASIDADREFANLSSAIRLFVLGFYQEQLQKLTIEHSGRGQVTEALLRPVQ